LGGADPDKGWQILVRIEEPGVEPERRGALQGWEATPHQQLERLLRETGVPTGLLLTDGELRVIQAPRGETSGWLKFPLARRRRWPADARRPQTDPLFLPAAQ
jgi:hypothetical protein